MGALAHLTLLHGVSVPMQLSSVVKKAMTAPGISFPAIGWLLGDEDLEVGPFSGNSHSAEALLSYV